MTITRPLIYLVAGEPSGDLMAAHVMTALKKQTQDNVDFAGVGGQSMINEGLISLFPMKEIAVMGIIEIIPHIPNVLTRLQQTFNDIVTTKPDVVVTFDAPGFNFRLAKSLQKLGIPLVHYTAPSVWAWRPHRAQKVAQLYDHLLTLFAFEPAYFQVHGLQTTFVGHPLIEKNIDQIDPQLFKSRHSLSPEDPLIVVLPGSRVGEIKRLLPIFTMTLQALQEQIPRLHVVIPTLPHLVPLIKSQVNHLHPFIVIDEADKFQAMRAADCSLVASGTTTLELALAGTPMVAAYKINKITEWIIRPLIKINHFALPNILAGREIVKEFMQEHCTPDNLYNELLMLLKNKSYHQNQKFELQGIIPCLQNKQTIPSVKAAQIILQLCKVK